VSEVDLVINVFERTYREVLRPGQVLARAQQHSYPFARRVILINNVDDPDELQSRLDPLLSSGEITEVHFVEERLDEALRKTGLTRGELEPVLHYSDCSLVALTLPGSPFVAYVDAEVHLAEEHDWITPALQMMQEDKRVAVANPDWTPSTLEAETREMHGQFALGYGFSDQLYLVKREEFAAAIYGYWCPMSWRYPLSHFAAVFEQRVDSYMRTHGRLRATYMGVRLEHRSDEGAGYRKTRGMLKWKSRAMHIILKSVQLLPGSSPRYHS
jgi:hypothetical protein